MLFRSIEEARSAAGGVDQLVVIETDKKQEVAETVKPPVVSGKEDFIKAVRDSGLVGLGGASFPTHVKYNPKNLDEVDTLIVNAAECEPFITSDHRLMLEDTRNIIDGILTVMKYLDLKKAYIGVESNKPDAIEKLKEEITKSGHPEIEVITLRSKYGFRYAHPSARSLLRRGLLKRLLWALSRRLR